MFGGCMDERLYTLLRDLLGQPENPNSQWTYFKCPFCNHHRKKFAFNVQEHKWHCWVCKTRGNNLFSLLRKLNKWSTFKPRVEQIVKRIKPFKKQKSPIQISLPPQYISLRDPKDFPLKSKAINYLKRRGIGNYEIWKYDIGFCNRGQYEDRIIIPSFNEDNQLNYYTARTIHSHESFKYMNPRFQKDSVIIFENMINWNFPVVITQGMFDAITVNFNSVPLMGKTISKKLLQKILYYDADICLSLDNDAQEDQHQIITKMSKLGIENISFINLIEKDPSSMNRWDYWKYLLKHRKSYTQTTEFEMLKEKVGQMTL